MWSTSGGFWCILCSHHSTIETGTHILTQPEQWCEGQGGHTCRKKNQIHVFFVISHNSPPDDPAEQQILVDAAGFWWILVDSAGFWWIKAVRVLCWDNFEKIKS